MGIKSVLSHAGGALLTGAGLDYMMHEDYKHWDKMRVGNLLLNMALGGAAGGAAAKGKVGEMAAGLGGAVGKDLALSALPLMGKLNHTLDATNTVLKNQPTEAAAGNANDAALNNTIKYVGAGALGLGAAGLLAKVLASRKQKKEVGRIRYKIPGRNGDPNSAAIVEVPLTAGNLSPAMLDSIDTNIKRQAVRNIKANMRKRDPETGKLIPIDVYEAKYGMLKGAGVLTRNSADGAAPGPAVTHSETDDFTLEDFFRLQAGGAFNAEGSTVKNASRAFHEGAGSVLTSLLGAAAGGYIGNKYIKTSDPRVGGLAGAAVGALTPFLLGRGVASLQEEARSAESQEKHDDDLPALEYLLPGYADYNYARRRSSEKAKAKEMQAVGSSFGATGMNPVPPTQGESLEEADAADEVTGRTGEEGDDFDEFSKFAGQVPSQVPSQAPPQAPAPQAAGGKPTDPRAVAPVKNPSQTAQKLTTPGKLTSRFASIQQSINGLKAK